MLTYLYIYMYVCISKVLPITSLVYEVEMSAYVWVSMCELINVLILYSYHK